jgi:hypothetical protein
MVCVGVYVCEIPTLTIHTQVNLLLNAVILIGIPNCPNKIRLLYYWLWPFGWEYRNERVPEIPPADPRKGIALQIWNRYNSNIVVNNKIKEKYLEDIMLDVQ